MNDRPYLISYFMAKYRLSRAGVAWIAGNMVPAIQFIRPLCADDVIKKKKTKGFRRLVNRMISAKDGARLDAYLAEREQERGD